MTQVVYCGLETVAKDLGKKLGIEAVPLSRKVAAELGEQRRVAIVVQHDKDPGYERFWRYLKRSRDDLKKLQFALIGDDSQESNLLSSEIAEKLTGLGASRVESIEAEEDAPTVAVETSKVLHVMFASQTGNAASIAENLHAEMLKRGADASLGSLDDWKDTGAFQKGTTNIVIASTTGNGDPPDNGERFWREFAVVTKKQDPNSFKDTSFAVLGLGDTNYDKFCHCGKTFDRRLADLGGNRVLPLACGDEAMELEVTVEAWLDDVWSFLIDSNLVSSRPASKKKVENDLTTIDPDEVPGLFIGGSQTITSLEPAVALTVEPRALAEEHLGPAPLARTGSTMSIGSESVDETTRAGLAMSFRRPFVATIKARRVLADADGRKVLHIDLDVAGSKMRYRPGDSVGIKCPNPPEMLSLAKDLLQGGEIEETPVDLSAFATRAIVRAVAGWCTDEKDRARCLLLASRPAGTALFDLLVGKPKLRALEFLKAIPSAKPTMDDLLKVLPPLSARYYSVASSPLVDPDKLSIAFSVVRYTVQERELRGVCTSWLEGLDEGAKVPVFLKPSESFALPSDPEKKHLVMIGPGTGVAPFMGFLEDIGKRSPKKPTLPGSRPTLPGSRPQIPALRKTTKQRPKLTLYFGCRSQQDWLYRDEMRSFANSLDLNLRLAFSREDASKKVYVQHLISQDAAMIADHLTSEDAVIYVCGDGANMAKDVHSALAGALVETKRLSSQEAALAKLDDLKLQGRYLLDVWSPVDDDD